MAVGPITNPTTPIAIGTVATPTWASNVEDDINAMGFTQIPKAYILSSLASNQYIGAGTAGGWTDSSFGYVTASASTNYLMFPIELPFITGAAGTSSILTGATVRVKPNAAGTMSARIFGVNAQNTTGSTSLVLVSTAVSSSGTAEQILTVPATGPTTMDATTAYWVQVIAGNTSDRVYSVQVQYTTAGY